MSDAVGAVAVRLAALLQGGLNQQRALEQLARDESLESHTIARIYARVRQGEPVGTVMAEEPDEAWKLLSATLTIAETTGAPIVPALERMSEALSRLAALARRREVLLAGPKGSVLLIASLPFVTVIVGELLGVHVAGQVTTLPGIALVIVGVLLLTVGISWGLGMIGSVQREDHAAGFELDLLWIALAGGGSPEHARRIVVHTVDALGLTWVNLEAFSARGEATELLDATASSGISLRELVVLQAETLRENTHRDLERRAEQLAVKILMPLGLCVLPAFVCIGVIPLLLAMLG